MYQLGFPAKYRREVYTEEVEESLKEVCLGIAERHEIRFIEIGMEEDHASDKNSNDNKKYYSTDQCCERIQWRSVITSFGISLKILNYAETAV